MRVQPLEEQSHLGLILGAVSLAVGGRGWQLSGSSHRHQGVQAGGVEGLLEAFPEFGLETTGEVTPSGIAERHPVRPFSRAFG